jgi:carbamoyl-phosphate synthase large subunit
LDEIGKTCPLDMIVPCLDTEIPNYIELHTELKQRGIKLPLVTQTMFNRRDKQNLAKLGKAAKVRVPRTEIADTLEDLRDCCGAIGFPVFVKGKMYGGAKANTPMEAVQIYRSLIAAWGGPSSSRPPSIARTSMASSALAMAKATSSVHAPCEK